MTSEQRERILAESPTHGPALVIEIDSLRAALSELVETSVAGKDGYFKAKENARKLL